MNGIGGPEVLVILLVALLVFGPKSIPEVARTVGRGMRELRRLATEFQREVNLADAHDEDVRPPAIRPPAAPPEAAGAREGTPDVVAPPDVAAGPPITAAPEAPAKAEGPPRDGPPTTS